MFTDNVLILLISICYARSENFDKQNAYAFITHNSNLIAHGCLSSTFLIFYSRLLFII